MLAAVSDPYRTTHHNPNLFVAHATRLFVTHVTRLKEHISLVYFTDLFFRFEIGKNQSISVQEFEDIYYTFDFSITLWKNRNPYQKRIPAII